MSSPELTISTIISLLGEMFDCVDEQLANAVNALYNSDVHLARYVCLSDRRVDELELQIDGACAAILDSEHVEGDRLRMVISAMRITADLERIGDQSKNVAKSVSFLCDWNMWQSETQIFDMADTVRAVVRMARDTFVERHPLKARQVLALDRRVDRAYRSTTQTIIKLCALYPGQAEALVHLVTLSKAFERIADHAKSIARSVVYLVVGTDIRHQQRRPDTAVTQLA